VADPTTTTHFSGCRRTYKTGDFRSTGALTTPPAKASTAILAALAARLIMASASDRTGSTPGPVRSDSAHPGEVAVVAGEEEEEGVHHDGDGQRRDQKDFLLEEGTRIALLLLLLLLLLR